MAQPTIAPYPISDFIEWNASKRLRIAPEFQRRDVWIPKAKSYLIDTIIRELPIPPLFIRLKIDPINKRVIREVVDGQQRLRAVLDFIAGEFSILKVHNSELGGKYYTDLPETLQHNFLTYNFLVNTLQDVSDSEVLGIFARLNTYTVKLNAQELRNAAYFGVFKQTVYKLAQDYYTFWREKAILSDQQIARMGDAELVSVLLVSILDGIRQTKALDLKSFYEDYDDDFPKSDQLVKQFQETMNLIGNIFGDKLRLTPFRRSPLFYTLFCGIFDAKFGLPHSKNPRIKFSSSQIKAIRSALWDLSKAIISKKPSTKYMQFIEDAKISTADIGRRRNRHKFIWKELFSKI